MLCLSHPCTIIIRKLATRLLYNLFPCQVGQNQWSKVSALWCLKRFRGNQMPFVFSKSTCVRQLSTFLLYLQTTCPLQYLDTNRLWKKLLHLPSKLSNHEIAFPHWKQSALWFLHNRNHIWKSYVFGWISDSINWN